MQLYAQPNPVLKPTVPCSCEQFCEIALDKLRRIDDTSVVVIYLPTGPGQFALFGVYFILVAST